ncbi:CRTAC1 family protein [Elongatibacter sediminis]|uniref:CRTAC1 family protein n=1 Tax=Elongatibacter sediminis TaxID=3119006 RepID=A0AAW9RQB2_9GAMM
MATGIGFRAPKIRLLPARGHAAALVLCLHATVPDSLRAGEWAFTEISGPAGAAVQHTLSNTEDPGVKMMAGGVAAGDFDRDGDTDLYVVTGDAHPNALLRNNGDGSFSDIAAAAGVTLPGHVSSGPAFADLDADGWPDLVVGGVAGSGYRVFRNRGDGGFEDVTGSAGITGDDSVQNDYSSAFGDPDGDGDLDLFVTHWGANVPTNHLWFNRGDGRFAAGDDWAGIDAFGEADWSFAPVFTDIDGDGVQDLLVTADYGTSQVFMCAGGGRFENTTTEVIDDENGMGSAAADFDNDGDIDWFVTSVWDPAEPHTWGSTGNRLYLNDGSGTFENVTTEAGVEIGHWGWGACAADFDNDGWLDIVHVNGFPSYGDHQTDFRDDPSLLYMNQGDGTFIDRAEELGFTDTGQGRGVVCFDYDADGDVDIFTANWEGPARLYRNDLDDNPGWLQVNLTGEADNPDAIGAVIRVTTGDLTQMREVTVGSNYESQNPLTQHFGLGGAASVDEVRVTWPHGGETVLTGITANQRLTVDAASAQPPPFALQPGMSAAWYDPSRSGEGFMLELLAGGRAVVYWFTYDDAGEQDWYIAIGSVTGRRILFPELLRVSGGEFGPGFDPDRIDTTVVGSAAFTWTGCDEGAMDWFIGDDQGRMRLQRLSRVMGANCGSPGTDPVSAAAGLSGSWYDPAHTGEGYVLEVLADGRTLVYWFSFDPQGARRWFFGVGGVENGSLVFEELLTTRGARFGEAFNPDDVEAPPWGSLQLTLDCDGGSANWQSTEAGFGPGTFDLKRLSSLDGIDCP